MVFTGYQGTQVPQNRLLFVGWLVLAFYFVFWLLRVVFGPLTTATSCHNANFFPEVKTEKGIYIYIYDYDYDY